MNIAANMLSNPVLVSIGWTLLHSLWQLTAVALVLAVVLGATSSRATNLRYVACAVSLLLMIACCVATFTVQYSSTEVRSPLVHAARNVPSESPLMPELAQSREPAETKEADLRSAVPLVSLDMRPDDNLSDATPSIAASSQSWSDALDAWLPSAALAWMCGVALLSFWNLAGWMSVSQLRRSGVDCLSEQVKSLASGLATRMNVSRPVQLLQSSQVGAPMVIGWLKPVVLLPASLLAELSPAQLESILAHELAHIRRHDYLVNLLQTALETVLFYHPAIWWVSRRLREEREHCCDEMAVRVSGSRIDLSEALTKSAAARVDARLAVAAARRSSGAVRRVRRLLEPESPRRELPKASAAAAALVLMSLGLALHWDGLVAAQDGAGERDDNVTLTDSLGDPLPEAALLRLGTKRFCQPTSVAAMALSPDEETIVTIGRSEMIAWDVQTGKRLWRAEPSQLKLEVPAASYGTRPLAFSADGSRLYTPGDHNEAVVWDVATGEHRIIKIPGTLPRSMDNRMYMAKSIDITDDARKLALGNWSGVVVCDETGNVHFEIPNRPDRPVAADDMNGDRLNFGGHYGYAQFSPDESILAVALSESPNEIRLVDANTGDELRRIQLSSRLVRFAFSPNGDYIVATERDVAARQYAVVTGEEVWSFVIVPNTRAESYLSDVAYSPTGNTIAVGAPIGSDYGIRLLDAGTGEEIGNLTGSGWKPWAVAFSNDGETLYSNGWDGVIRRWDVAEQTQLPLPEGVRATSVVAASPDGRMLAYADESATVHLVDHRTGAELRTLSAPNVGYGDLTFSPDSKWLAGGGGKDDHVSVVIWDLSNDKVIHRWDWPKGDDPHSDIESLAFHPDGKRLAGAVFRQDAAYLWDLTTGEQVAELPHIEVYGLSFSPNGQTLATAGWDRIVRFWSTEGGELQREVNIADALDHNADEWGNDDDRMYTVRYAPTGGIIATAHLDGKTRVWNASDMAMLQEFQVPGRFIYGSICFSPDGSLLATGSMQGDVQIWDPLTAEVVWDAGQHESYAYKVEFGADNRTLVSGGSDNVCYLWDLQPRDLQLPEWDAEALWSDLAGDGGAAYRATWVLTGSPKRATQLIADKLRSVTSVMDLNEVVAGLSEEEAARRRRLTRQLVGRDDSVELAIVVQRAIAILRRLQTQEANDLLQELANQEPVGDVGRRAAEALGQPL